MSRRYGTKGCIAPGCEKKHRRNGYCATHSTRIFRHGDLEQHYPWAYKTPEERKAAIKKSQRAYDQTPKGKAASVLKRHRRRHKEGGEVTLTVDDVLAIKMKFQFQCFKCKIKDDLTLDHHVPLAKGGKMIKENCAILCRKCNGIKADLMPEEFYSVEERTLISELLG